ncbi:MAG: VWA domain-containing protein [Bacteroidetes bacterium]|nr:MAG: VWA domain-containing protein [Bacteroidota bacterium]
MKKILKLASVCLLATCLFACNAGQEKSSTGLRDRTEEKLESPKSEERKESPAESESSKKDAKQKDKSPESPSQSNPEFVENSFVNASQMPTSTFSIDVDNASYTYSRSMIENGSLPPADRVRTEEFINYFDYVYPQPKANVPFSVYQEVANCPWKTNHKLVHIGLQGKTMDNENRKNANLVFLIDVSGSMQDDKKLPLLKKSFEVLVNELGENDKISMVVYAGAAGLVLPPTSGANKKTILNMLNNLTAGGSTAGGEGLRLAYQVAEKNKLTNGNNRVIIASDGDFNVGESSDEAMQTLIEEKRKSGIFITVLGFGMGSYQDNKMEIIANKGNGNYYYIDNVTEAKKVFSTGLTGTLFTIAKDVKIQVEFNPNVVKQYRLLGYENRMLNKEDFEDDKKDAGEIGAGHTVTAIYEVELNDNNKNATIGELRMRYKEPQGEKSLLITQNIKNDDQSFENSSNNFRFSAAVAGFAMCLRKSQYKGTFSFNDVLRIGKSAKGKDIYNYRTEFLELVNKALSLPQ